MLLPRFPAIMEQNGGSDYSCSLLPVPSTNLIFPFDHERSDPMNTLRQRLRSPGCAHMLWVALCFGLTSAVYLSWLDRLVALTGGAADWLSMVAGYLCQALGLLAASVWLERHPEGDQLRPFAWTALLFDEVAGAVPVTPWTGDRARAVLADVVAFAAAATPCPVPDLPAFMEEVKTVRKVELVGFEQELEFNADIAVGDRFQIQSGVWEGVTGWLTSRDKKFKWTVQFEFVNETVTTTINPSKFKMIKLD